LRPRSVALVTWNPALYSELAGFLRERRLPSVSLLPGQRIPDRVAVVLTSSEEAPSIVHANVLAVGEDSDHRALSAAVEHALGPGQVEQDLVVGIDPGPRPGYAIFAGSRCLGEGVLDSPEAAGTFSTHLRRQFPTRHVVFRVGSGDPPRRNRLVNELLAHHRWVEIVDEQGTTPRGRRRPRDPAAARSIARGLGRSVRDRLPTTFTPGEISNLQRLSREGSGGLVTITRSSAHAVLRGEITLADAVAEKIGRNGSRRVPTGPTPANRGRRERL
jgi:hypothetical protein